MDELIKLAITAIIGAVGGALTPVLVARYSKSREERDSGLVVDYIKIADMTGAQLEKKINQINQLEAEIQAIKAARVKREEEHTKEINELRAHIQADLIDTRSLRADYAVAQKQIIHHEALIVSLGEYVEAQNKAIQEAGIKVEVNGKFKKLLESVHRLKAEKPK